MTIPRREMLKKAVAGSAAAGVVWSAPKVEGLSLRPNYAAAASGVNSTTVSVPTMAAPGGLAADAILGDVPTPSIPTLFRVGVVLGRAGAPGSFFRAYANGSTTGCDFTIPSLPDPYILGDLTSSSNNGSFTQVNYNATLPAGALPTPGFAFQVCCR